MTPSELKCNVETKTDSNYFSRSSMKFFGDTMKNYGVRSATINTHYNEDGNYVGTDGVAVEVWELYRKNHVKHGLKNSHYFDKKTFNNVTKD